MTDSSDKPKSTKNADNRPANDGPGRMEAIRNHYEPRLRKYRRNFEILDWASPKSQQARFAVLAGQVDLQGKTLLDVGCGLGDLWTFLKDRGIRPAYTGLDILETMIQAARKRHPDARFLAADVFAKDVFPPGAFDVVFCSGALNLNLGNNRQFLPHAIARLLSLASQCLVFNLLHRRAAFQEDTYAYSHPQDVLAILQPLGCQPQVLDDYLHNDFTVICRKAPQ